MVCEPGESESADWTATQADGRPIMRAKIAAIAPIFAAVLSEKRSEGVFRGEVDAGIQPVSEPAAGSSLEGSTCLRADSPARRCSFRDNREELAADAVP